jgi:hypothetical protein
MLSLGDANSPIAESCRLVVTSERADFLATHRARAWKNMLFTRDTELIG